MVGGWAMRVGLALLVCHLVFFVSWVAHAQGVLLDASKMDGNWRAALQSQVQRAKQLHPESFSKIRKLQGHHPRVYRSFRTQQPSVIQELQALGPGAGWAMIDAIAFDGLDRGDANEREWDAVREGLLLALGELEMTQASPILQEAFAIHRKDWIVLRASAIGLGRLGGEKERTLLFRALTEGGEQRNAALWGLRHVRTLSAVDAVTPLLHDSSAETVQLAARALGYQGSSWAWKTGKAGDASVEMTLRTRCMDALLNAYLRHDKPLREQIARALSMVDHPEMSIRIEHLRESAANEEDRLAWSTLKRRLFFR
jgi:hypothetical protein